MSEEENCCGRFTGGHQKRYCPILRLESKIAALEKRLEAADKMARALDGYLIGHPELYCGRLHRAWLAYDQLKERDRK